MSTQIKDICQFEQDKLDLLGSQDEWWQKAGNWYEQVKDLDFEQLNEVQKGWIGQMKVRYQKESE